MDGDPMDEDPMDRDPVGDVSPLLQGSEGSFWGEASPGTPLEPRCDNGATASQISLGATPDQAGDVRPWVLVPWGQEVATTPCPSLQPPWAVPQVPKTTSQPLPSGTGSPTSPSPSQS